MTKISIYMEGGGCGPHGKATLRQGMDRFLKQPKQAAREKSLRWQLVTCGSRGDTYDCFKNAVDNADPDETQILLVDSEALVDLTPKAHLQETDGWDLSSALKDTIHLMAQVMETWIVADAKALARYYGQGFNEGKLPKRRELEQVPKNDVENALKDATKRTGKGEYHKIKHASELLKQLDQARVKEVCPHCKQLFKELDRIIEAA